MHKTYGSYSIAALVILAVSCCLPPLAMILGTCLLIKPLIVTIEVNDLLQSGTVFELPDWINDCSRGDEQFLT